MTLMMKLRGRSQTTVLISGRRSVLVVARSTKPGGEAPTMTFEFPEALNWQTPGELGRAFAARAVEQGFQLHAIGSVGLPAGWMALRQSTFPPPQDRRLLPGIVEFAADDLFAERLDELALSYQVAVGTDVATASILACHRNRLDQLQAFLAAAGIVPQRIVPLAVAVTQAIKLPTSQSVLLLQYGHEAEIALVDAGRVMWMATIDLPDSPADEVAEVADEFRRVRLNLPPGGPRTLIALADRSLSHTTAQALHLETIEAMPIDAAPGVGGHSPLALMAAGVLRSRTANLNFLTSSRPRSLRDWRAIFKRTALAAVLLLAVLGYFAYDWFDARNRAADFQQQIDSLALDSANILQLKALNDATDPWFRTHPDHLHALLALTRQFPDDGVIWLTSCEVDETGRVTVVGRARSRAAVLTLLTKLETSGEFDGIAPSYVRQQSAGDGLVTFAATCRHRQGDDL